MKLSVKKILELCDGELYCGSRDVICSNFTKDTRIMKNGDTFIGIKGENYNGNDYYLEAFNNGANCAIIEKKYFKIFSEFNYIKPIILVDDSIDVLKKLATYIRNQVDAYVVGVTGSVGKTSTRDMIYSVLKQEFLTLKTDGNYNNNIGLPLTLMRLTNEKAAVIEMGMNHLGEISYLSNITRPNIGVITNIGTAHIGELGSRENILKAKLEILTGMSSDGALVINNDNDLLHNYYLKQKNNVVTVGIDNESDFLATDLELFSDYSIFKIKYNNKFYNIYCPVPGKAFVYNSLIAFAVGTLLNIEKEKIIYGIRNFELTKNRMEIIEFANNIKIINGAYNASVDSMKSNIEILKNQSGKRKIAVLGSMLELGEFSEYLHREVGRFVVSSNIDILVTIGDDAKYIALEAQELGMNLEKIYIFENNEEAIELLKEIILPEDIILFKASNGLKFGKIIDAMISYFGVKK